MGTSYKSIVSRVGRKVHADQLLLEEGLEITLHTLSFVCVHTYVCVHMCLHEQCPKRPGEGVSERDESESLQLELQVVLSCLMWVPRTELRSSERTICILNH